MVAAPEVISTPPVSAPGVDGKVAGETTVVPNGITPHENGVLADASTSHNSNFDPTPPTTISNLPPLEISRLIPCRNFPLGTCKYADQCAFSHNVPAGTIPPPQNVQPPAPGMMQQPMGHEFGAHEMQQMYYAPMQQGEQEYLYHQQQQQFSNGQQFYPFPPPFQHYPQQHYQHGPPQQQYFQHPQQIHQHQQPLAPIPVVDAAAAPVETASPSTTTPVALPSPSAELEAPAAAVLSTEESTVSPVSPSYAPVPQQAFLPYPQQNFGAQYGFAPNPLSPTLANNAPLGTFFPAGTAAHYANGYSKGPGAQRQSVPRRSIDDQSPPSTSSLPLGGKTGPDARPARNGRYNSSDSTHHPRTTRPNCSFFEANRCRNRDACPFAHLLPDGTDARTLGRGLVGIDGRIDGPEERGGMPPAWIAHPKNSNGHPRYNNNNNNHQSSSAGGAMSAAQMGGRQSMNGGFSAKERNGRRFEDEQVLRAGRVGEATAGVEGGVEEVAGGEASGEQVLTDSISSLTSATSSLSTNTVPGGQQARSAVNGNGNNARVNAAPSLVAAINGLTRRTPPVATPTPSTPPAHTAAQAARQRVPSGADFPALATTDGSPQQFVAPALTLAELISAAATGLVAAPVASAPVATIEKKEVAPTSPTSETDFVLVNHTDAPLPLVDPSIVSISPSSTPIVATPTPAIVAPVVQAETPIVAARPAVAAPVAAIPKAVFSFAAAARKGAAIPPPVVPEKVKRAAPVFASSTVASSGKGEKGEKGEKDEVVVVKKKGKGGKKSTAPVVAQVAVVA